MPPGCVLSWSHTQQGCKPKGPGPGPKPSDTKGTPLLRPNTGHPHHCLDHLAAARRMLLWELGSPGELDSKAALGWRGCVGSPWGMGIHGGDPRGHSFLWKAKMILGDWPRSWQTHPKAPLVAEG